jgi:dienelactone hydrolase
MKSDVFSRRKFVSSVVAGAGLMAINPLVSFGNTIADLDFLTKTHLLFYVDSKGRKRRVKTPAEWQIKRDQILQGMQQAMGKLPDRLNLPELDMQIIDELKEENFTRLSITFMAAKNEKVPAYLYVPHQKGNIEKKPGILALHPTGEIGKKVVDGQGPLSNRAYARELAQRGYVVIAPDYPGFGDLRGYDFKADRYESGTMKSIFDNIRCIDLLQSRVDVDPDRIGAIGHSLGGHNALFTGAFDKRLKVIVSSCGWTLLDYYNAGKEVTEKYGGALGPWAQEQYMPLLNDKYHLDARKIPFDFDEVIAALAPRAFFSNSPSKDGNFNLQGVKKGIEEVSEVYDFLGAGNKLVAEYPDSGHDFPPEVRFKAYEFIDKILNVSNA